MIVWCATAFAGTALDGSTGLVRLPAADTVPSGRVRASAGLQIVRAYDGVRFGGFPVGFAGGLGDSVEVGAHVDRIPTFGLEDPAPPPSVGAYVRARPLDPHRGWPGLAFQANLEGIGRELGGGLTAIAAIDRPHTTYLLEAGPRLSRAGLFLWQGFGVERTWRSFSAVIEQELATGAGGLDVLQGRGGVRVRLRDRAQLMVWGGGGREGASPWGGGGVAIQVSSADPRGQDTDRDTILDWTERCRFDREDVDGFEDADGCPDPDNDADGIPDFQDPTPNGEPPADPTDLPGDTPTLKMRIKQRPMPGPVDPNKRSVPHG